MLIDIHTHIQQHASHEWDDMLQRAADAEVGAIIAAGTTIEDSGDALEMAKRYYSVFAGVGIHPSELKSRLTSSDLQALDEMAGDRQTVVMSEVGIDHMPRSPDHSWQEEAFAHQIEIAKRHDLPIVFHVREELDDLTRFEARGSALRILSDMDVSEIGGAAHYFQGNWDYAQKVLDLGFMISFAKPLLRSTELQEVAAKAPLDMIVLETDAYPQPFKKNRAKWTEPKDVLVVAKRLAQTRGISLHEVAYLTTRNAIAMLRTRATYLEWITMQLEKMKQS